MVNLKYCWKPPDRLNLSLLSGVNLLSIRFSRKCKLGIRCSGSSFSSITSSFNSFWSTHFYKYYFTTRSLDANGNVKFTVNSETGLENLVSSNGNYPAIYISDTLYNVDDSVIWGNSNRTFKFEMYNDRLITTQFPSSFFAAYGI